jgi:mycofactocin precursor
VTQSDTPSADAPPRAGVMSAPAKTATAPSAPATTPSHPPTADDLLEADLLVEDVSIDGMCGVY